MHMIEYIPEEYRRVILEEIRAKEVWLGEGKAESFERYKEVTGQIKGLKASLSRFQYVLIKSGVEDE